MKSITICLPTRGNHPRGGFKVVYEYANMLVADGYKVTVNYPAEIIYKNDSVKTRFIKILRIIYHLLQWHLTGYSCKKWFKLEYRVKEKFVLSLNYCNVTKADVFIATSVETAIAMNLYDKDKLKILYLIQDFENWGVTEENVYDTYNYGFKNIVISKWLADRVHRCGAECTIIPNGFDFSYFTLRTPIENRNRYSISMLYHLNERKGCADGIDAVCFVKEKFPQLVVTFFGVPERPKDLPEWIEYYQQPDKDTHNRIYNESSIYLAPSKQEGWGLTVGEAMICGAAVVCTDTQGFKEMVVDGVNGLISPVSNSKKLADNIIKLLEDDRLRQELALAGNKSIQKFSWTRSYALLRNMIES